jgi:hypothetical protein
VRTLVFAIATLHLLVDALLHFPLQNSRTRGLVIFRDFEDVSSIDPVVSATAHHMVAVDSILVDWNLEVVSTCSVIGRVYMLTLL